MKITYKLKTHTIRPDTPIVELWIGKSFIGELVESIESTPERPVMNFISKHLKGARCESTPLRTMDNKTVSSVKIVMEL